MNFLNKKEGFTLVELIIYIFVTSILLIVVSSLVLGIFNTRRRIIASQLIYSDARFIMNYLNNRIHNVDLIDNVSPASEEFHFYNLPDTRFSLELDNGDLIYRETVDAGSGFPDQSSGEAIYLNSDAITVSSFVMVPYDDNDANPNRAIRFNIVLSAGDENKANAHIEEMFGLFFTLR